MGRAGIRRPSALREAHARRLPGRPVVDHDLAQARELSPRLPWLRAGKNCPLYAQAGRAPDAGRGHRAQPHEDRRHRTVCAGLARGDGKGSGLLAPAMGFCRRQAQDQQVPRHRANPSGNRGVAENLQGFGDSRFQVLRPDHRLRFHAGGRHGQRSSGKLPSPCGMREARWQTMTVPSPSPRKSARPDAPRAWQRMLSGRRLDLLDPSPLDIEIVDIAHGLARVARWNGQTEGAHIFSVAQHSLLVETIARQSVRLDRKRRLAVLLHDAPEYVIGDIITPFKAVIGDTYKAVEARLLAAVHLRFGLPVTLPAELIAIIKVADRAAAYLEATRLAGFAALEARHFFGRPPQLTTSIERDYLTPWPAEIGQARYLDRFETLARA